MASTSVVFDIIARDNASAKFDKLGHAVDGSGTKMSKFTDVMKTAGKAAAYGLGAGLVIAAGAAVKFTQAAAQDAQAAELLSGALRRNADATDEQVGKVEKWITAVGRAKGVADDELRPALARLVTATHDVGAAQDLATLAMDVSAASGKSLESISTALMKAQNGQVSSLSRLGINTKLTADEQVAYAKAAVAASDGTLTMEDALKKAASQTITMEQATKRMADQFGGAAQEKANTFAGKMDRLKLMLSEAGESIGAVLLPYATQFADWIISDGIPKVEKFVRQFENARGEGGRFRDRLEEVWDKLKKVANFAADHKDDILKLAAAFMAAREAARLWTGAQLLLNAALSANPIGITIMAVAGLSAAFVVAYNKSETFRGVVAKVREIFMKFVGNAYEFASALTGKVTGAIASVTGVANRFKDAIDSIIGSVQSLVGWLGNIKMPSIDWPEPPGWLGGKFGRPGKQGIEVGGAGASLIESIVKGIGKHKVKLDTALSKLKDYIAKHLGNLSELMDKRAGILDAFKGMTSSIFSADLSVAEGAPAASAGTVVDFGAQRRANAEALSAAVQTLIGKGLSTDLIQQLMGAGEAGQEQIKLLASGTNEQIAQANADNAATQQALQAAGIAASAALGVDAAIATEKANIKLATDIKDGLKELLDEQDKNTVVELHLDGHKILWSLKKIKRQNGGKLGLGDRDDN
jgi:hypothetical protein